MGDAINILPMPQEKKSPPCKMQSKLIMVGLLGGGTYTLYKYDKKLGMALAGFILLPFVLEFLKIGLDIRSPIGKAYAGVYIPLLKKGATAQRKIANAISKECKV